jgi:predicted lactoylglutathione lyase
MNEMPKLGHHFELCFSVDDLKKSVEYYQKLGFRIYTGGIDKEWCTITDGNMYFGLFPANFIETEFGKKFVLNYRGGNIKVLTEKLEEEGIEFYKKHVNDDGTGSALFKDINGNVIFLDTAADEERIDVPE